MEAKLVTHVSDLILLVCSARQSLKRTLFDIVACDRRPRVARFGQTSFQNLHYTVRICMTVGISGALETFVGFTRLHTNDFEDGKVSKSDNLTGAPTLKTHRSKDRRRCRFVTWITARCQLRARLALEQQTFSTNCDSERIRSAFV
jgi:hypothetical protein